MIHFPSYLNTHRIPPFQICSESTMLDIKWDEEATGVINDIKQFVKDVHLCQIQPNIDQMVLLNLETFENDKFCIKLCASGFGVTGNNFDAGDSSSVEKWYETPYALLTDLSSSYIVRFNQSLIDRLQTIEN